MRSWKALIAGLIIAGFGVAMLLANKPERAQSVADELVETTNVLPENEGKLVMVSGTPELVDGGKLVDEETGLKVENALYYGRIPYQKVYALHSREVVVDKGEDKVSTTDDITETEHYVAEEWIIANHEREAVISSTAKRYENPPALPLSAFHAFGDLRISGFEISYADVRDYIETKNCSFTKQELEDSCGTYILRSEIDLQASEDEYGHGVLSSGDDVGDVYVTFSYETLAGANPVTIIGRQRGDKLVFEEDDLISEREHIRPGLVSKDEFVASLAGEDKQSMVIGIVVLVVGAVIVLLSLGWGTVRLRK